jgi:hypothetical protein
MIPAGARKAANGLLSDPERKRIMSSNEIEDAMSEQFNPDSIPTIPPWNGSERPSGRRSRPHGLKVSLIESSRFGSR